MNDSTFNDPKLAINKVYTKTGDQGKTSLVGGQRVSKDDVRIDAYGTVDELNAFVGSLTRSVLEELPESDDRAWFLGVLNRIQHELFNLGSILATLPRDVHPKQPQIREQDIARLEADIDRCNAQLAPLRSFVLPGGSRANTDLHICRTVCRRAERGLTTLEHRAEVPGEALRYLNRLSDGFFVWSRWVLKLLGRPEVLWEPNRAASAKG
jgi:cob(I)alamin adenosyltransferase